MSILQVQPHVFPTSGMMSSGFPGANALHFDVVGLSEPFPEPALGFWLL